MFFLGPSPNSSKCLDLPLFSPQLFDHVDCLNNITTAECVSIVLKGLMEDDDRIDDDVDDG